MGEKYVVIDKKNGFGYRKSKYADMFNMTKPEFAEVFTKKEDAQWIADYLNKDCDYQLEVFEYEEALLDIINEQAKTLHDCLPADFSKSEIQNNVVRNKMQTVMTCVNKLMQEREK